MIVHAVVTAASPTSHSLPTGVSTASGWVPLH